MNNTKLRFGAILLILSLVLVACGGSTEETVEEPVVEEAPAETLAAPATTSPPPEKLLIWAEEKIAVALDPLVGAYESAAGVDVEVVIYDFGSIKDDVLTAGPAGEGPDLFIGPHDMVGEVVTNGVVAQLILVQFNQIFLTLVSQHLVMVEKFMDFHMQQKPLQCITTLI